MTKFYVNLNSHFHLGSYSDTPFLYGLKLIQATGTSMEIRDFLETLPVQFITNGRNQFYNNKLYGESWQQRGTIAYVADSTHPPIDFFRHYTYSKYNDLKLDLLKINPSYKFFKKSGTNLIDPLKYFEEAIEGLSLDTLIPIISKTDQLLSIEDFSSYFHKIERDYVLPFKNLKHFPQLRTVFGQEIAEFPQYLLCSSNKEVLLRFVDHVYHVTFFQETITHDTFHEKELDKLIEALAQFFNATADNETYVYVDGFKGRTYEKYVHSTADLVLDHRTRYEDFSQLRRFFKEQYDVKGRGREQIWERGYKKMKETSFTYDYPFFESMDHQSSVAPDNTRNTELIAALESTIEFEQLDAWIKLKMTDHNGIYQDSNEFNGHFENIFGKSLRLFTMPNYGEIAENVPSFDAIIEKV